MAAELPLIIRRGAWTDSLNDENSLVLNFNAKPDLAKEYPLILISGPRVRYYIHSQLRNVEAMRKRHPDPLIQIHPDTANNLGIGNGDKVTVETKRGSVTMKAQLTPDILPQVVCIPHGWGGEANANWLTSDKEMDPITGFPAFKSMLCRVSKLLDSAPAYLNKTPGMA